MKKILETTLDIAARAGEKILEIYANPSRFAVDSKDDGSPLTVADKIAHGLIQTALENLDSSIPVLSEESGRAVFRARSGWNTFWLVDPLDGTKEFVNRNGEFTVNIALIENGAPILGVVHTPVKDVSHYAAINVGAFKKSGDRAGRSIAVRKMPVDSAIMVTSRSHSGIEVAQFQQNLQCRGRRVKIARMGSSLKICLVAEGSADIYPRLGPTSEWDTAAAQCVLEVAGGEITDLNRQRLTYNKTDILNPWFLAIGDKTVEWQRFLGPGPINLPAAGG